jgi:2-polyprenyl-6-methoxyphenol hydroxylase-like FAD-dependent oxidoreductase
VSSINLFLGLDVGTGDLIINGKVKIKQGTEPDYFTDDGLVFKDGSSLRADLVVFATGWQSHPRLGLGRRRGEQASLYAFRAPWCEYLPYVHGAIY